MIGHPLITTTSCRMQLMLCVYWREIYNLSHLTSHSEFTVYIFLYIVSINNIKLENYLKLKIQEQS